MPNSNTSPLREVHPFDSFLVSSEIKDDPKFDNSWQELFDKNPAFADFLVKQANIICANNPDLIQKCLRYLVLVCHMIEFASKR